MATARGRARPEHLQALGEAVHRAQRAWFRLGELVCDGLPVSPGQRRLMESIEHSGSSTVPELAYEDGVSRQHVQAQVNILLQEGLLRTKPNAAHRRSHLLQLTAAGRRTLNKVRAREQDVFETLSRRVPGCREATGVLDELCLHLDQVVDEEDPARGTA